MSSDSPTNGKRKEGKGKHHAKKKGGRDGLSQRLSYPSATSLPPTASLLPLASLPPTASLLPLASLPPISPTTDRKLVTQAAVRHSLTGGVFIDTKFWAFSRKRSTGIVDKPQAVYANSAILKQSCKFFEGLLTDGYREANILSLDSAFPEDHDNFTDEYEYFSDSDLDEDEESYVSSDTADIFEEGAGLGEDGPRDAAKQEDDPGKEDHLDATESLAPSNSSDLQNDFAPETEEGAKTNGVMIQSQHTGRRGRVVIFPAIAFHTLNALIFYLYTGEIAFAPLKSQKAKGSTISRSSSSAYGPPLCSPKSMYRIADKYGLNGLKEKAAHDIQSKLSPNNIVHELFSTISSAYEEIRKAQVNYACSQDVYRSMAANIPLWITRVSTGELAHCEGVVAALVAQLAANLTLKATTLTKTQASLTETQASLDAATAGAKAKCSNCSREFNQNLRCNNCHSYTYV